MSTPPDRENTVQTVEPPTLRTLLFAANKKHNMDYVRCTLKKESLLLLSFLYTKKCKKKQAFFSKPCHSNSLFQAEFKEYYVLNMKFFTMKMKFSIDKKTFPLLELGKESLAVFAL